MRTLLLTALLVAIPGASRAEDAPPPAQAAKPAKPAKAKGAQGPQADAKATGQKSKAEAASKTNPKAGEPAGAKGAGAPDPKPCEPVKPCPIE